MNLYGYCGNNPTNWIDPFGLRSRNESGGWDYNTRETEGILRSGRFSSCGIPVWNEALHFALPAMGGYDYKGGRLFWNQLTGSKARDRFWIPKQNGEKGSDLLIDSEFGNYIAGYLTQWHRDTVAHVHWAGDVEAGGKDDVESRLYINRGAEDAKLERKRQNEEFNHRYKNMPSILKVFIIIGPF